MSGEVDLGVDRLDHLLYDFPSGVEDRLLECRIGNHPDSS